MRSTIFLLSALFVLLSMNSYAELDHIKLTKALKTKMVSVKAVSTAGGYCGKGIMLALQNNTGTPMRLYIDPGMIFVPKDTAYQHLVLLGNEYIVLGTEKPATIELQTYCGKSYARGPKKGLDYNYWKQGDSLMINMLAHVKSNRITPTLAQHTVWMFTNDHCISGVYDVSKPDMSRKFVGFLSKLLNIPIPDYFVKSKLSDGQSNAPVYTQGSDTTYVDIHWNFIPRRNLHVAIYDAKGVVLKEIKDNEVITSEGHTVTVTFLPGEYPDGLYYVKMYDDENRVYITKRVYVGRFC